MTETKIKNYQERAARTLPDLGSLAANGAHMALGITTEVGEMLDGIENNDLVNIREEHGDCNWYIANECNLYGMDFEEIYKEAKGRKEEILKFHEIVDLHKKEFAYKKPMDTESLKELLIVTVWALQQICITFDFSYKDSLIRNIEKLYKRFPDKFTEEKAINRDLKEERKTLE